MGPLPGQTRLLNTASVAPRPVKVIVVPVMTLLRGPAAPPDRLVERGLAEATSIDGEDLNTVDDRFSTWD